jgi:hypothetical protein
MKISGFSMGKNASKLYYPWKESIESILPLVDEFVIALGDCDEDDNSRKLIESINSEKIRIIDTIWDLKTYPNGTENAHQTDIAKSYCIGDWLFYLQADEVVHEDDLPIIKARCQELLHDNSVEGLLFHYKHFWGNYNRYHRSHTWYHKEIRIIRNHPDIHSWESAQSFRRIPNFDGKHYRQQDGTYKLKVASVDATIFHYGWVRPPNLMMQKQKALDTIHKGADKVSELEKLGRYIFDYGPLQRLSVFSDSHPNVMKQRIKDCNWEELLQYAGKINKNRKKHRHEKVHYRILSWIENTFLFGRRIGGFKNYSLLKR